MMLESDPALPVIDALLAQQIPFMVVGSYSSNLYGIPRLTKDADLVVDLRGKSVLSLQAHLPAGMKLDPQVQFEGITATLKNVVSIDDSPFIVEIFRLGTDPHDQMRFSRRRPIVHQQRTIWAPTAEDVIVTKLRWARNKDREDVLNILAVQGDALDFAYIHQWCDAHGSRERLDEIRASIPKID